MSIKLQDVRDTFCGRRPVVNRRRRLSLVPLDQFWVCAKEFGRGPEKILKNERVEPIRIYISAGEATVEFSRLANGQSHHVDLAKFEKLFLKEGTA